MHALFPCRPRRAISKRGLARRVCTSITGERGYAA
jgi:hypothetical protein